MPATIAPAHTARVCYWIRFASAVHGGDTFEPVYATSPAEALAIFNADGPAVQVLSVGGPDFVEHAAADLIAEENHRGEPTMATTTNYTDLIGRRHSVTRYSKGDKLTFRSLTGERVAVVATGPGDPMEPGFTPVKVTATRSRTYPRGHVFTTSNAWLSPR